MFIAKFKYDGNDPEPTVLVTSVTETHLEGYNLNYASPYITLKIMTEMMIFSHDLLMKIKDEGLSITDPEVTKDYGYTMLAQFPELNNTYRKYKISGLKGKGIQCIVHDYSA